MNDNSDLYSGVSAWLRNTTGVSNEIVRKDMALAHSREASRIEKLRHKTGQQLQRVPPVWDTLGKRVSSGNIIRSGKYLEVWLSAEPFAVGSSEGGQKPSQPGKQPETVNAMRHRVNARARKQIRRSVNANNFQAMHTLTLALPSLANDLKYNTTTAENQRDYTYVRSLFKKFVQRLKRKERRDDIPYLVVMELHDSCKTSPEKRGTWHLHLCTEADSQLAKSISSTWNHGLTDYQDFRYDKKGNRRDIDIQNPGAYVAEYIGKEGAQFGSRELASKKRYTGARCNKKPVKMSIEGAKVQGDLDRLTLEGKEYKLTYYSCRTVPGTSLSFCNAHYMEV